MWVFIKTFCIKFWNGCLIKNDMFLNFLSKRSEIRIWAQKAEKEPEKGRKMGRIPYFFDYLHFGTLTRFQVLSTVWVTNMTKTLKVVDHRPEARKRPVRHSRCAKMPGCAVLSLSFEKKKFFVHSCTLGFLYKLLSITIFINLINSLGPWGKILEVLWLWSRSLSSMWRLRKKSRRGSLSLMKTQYYRKLTNKYRCKRTKSPSW